jgi:hypothetical protein
VNGGRLIWDRYFPFLILAKAILENYFPLLRREPTEAAKWYKQDAALDWIFGMGSQPERTYGQHSIFQFFKTIPELAFEIESYDCHPISADPQLTMLVVSGKACTLTSAQKEYSFHTTMHIQRFEGEARALIVYQSFFLL